MKANTYIMKGKRGGVGAFADKSFDADLTLLLLPERGRREDLVDHPRPLSTGEKRVEVIAAQKPKFEENRLVLTSYWLRKTGGYRLGKTGFN